MSRVSVLLLALGSFCLVDASSLRTTSLHNSAIDKLMDELNKIEDFDLTRCGTTGNEGLDKYIATIKYALLELRGKGTTTTTSAPNTDTISSATTIPPTNDVPAPSSIMWPN